MESSTKYTFWCETCSLQVPGVEAQPSPQFSSSWGLAVARPQPPFRRHRGARRGKITLVTCVAILGLIVLAGFVGNAGHVVTAKVSTQNAADAIAFSSAQWMARGMNAVTATNHLLGEVTALVVIIEGLGGPEADLKMEAYPEHSRIPDTVNRQLIPLAKVQGLVIYGAPSVGQFDEKFLNAVIKKLISPEKDPEHKAFATIYDGKVILKRAATKRLIAKMFANIGLYVPPPFGYGSAALAYAAHAIADAQLISIGKEYVILHGMELLVKSEPVRKFKVDLLEKKLVPALAAHGDYLAGVPPRTAQNQQKSESGVVNEAVRDTLSHLRDVYKVKAAIYPTAFTSNSTLRLPIEAEPAPPIERTFRAEKDWGTDELSFEDKDDQLGKVKKDIAEKKEQIAERIVKHEKDLAFLQALITDVEELKKKEGVTGQELTAINQEKSDLEKAIKVQQDLIAERKKDLEKLEKQEKEMDATIAKLSAAPMNGTGNLSAEQEHLAFSTMNQAKERYSQWVRATYPYVAAFRAPIITLFESELERSEAGKHYRKWTTRYTLTKSWQFRSGYRLTSDSKTQARWTNSDPKIKPLRMYVMDDSYVKDKRDMEVIRTGRMDRKGFEPWTLTTDDGKKRAEDKFTIVAITQSKLEPLFSPVLYPLASKRGMTTYAQAIFYNGNKQQPVKIEKTSPLYQAKLGWDTLNWDPDKNVPEWGAHTVLTTKKLWPWEIFDKDENKALSEHAAVKLNWQAKLMPVRLRRLTPAILAAGIESTDMGENVTFSLPFFTQLVHH